LRCFLRSGSLRQFSCAIATIFLHGKQTRDRGKNIREKEEKEVEEFNVVALRRTRGAEPSYWGWFVCLLFLATDVGLLVVRMFWRRRRRRGRGSWWWWWWWVVF
jgi:hypothetical protein